MVERTLGWLGRQRRWSKDYERKLQTSKTLLKLGMIRLLVRLLARSPSMMFKTRSKERFFAHDNPLPLTG
jgi:putative transposase